MSAKTKTMGLAADRLRAAKREFESWRRRCRGSGRIPTELWLLAAEAAEDLGVQETARQLQLDAGRLEHWVEQLGLSDGSKQPAGPEFVELAPMPWGPHGECQVEVEEPSGRKLRICLKGSAVAQLTRVLPALCGGEVAS
jgi:hypothetical protein